MQAHSNVLAIENGYKANEYLFVSKASAFIGKSNNTEKKKSTLSAAKIKNMHFTPSYNSITLLALILNFTSQQVRADFVFSRINTDISNIISYETSQYNKYTSDAQTISYDSYASDESSYLHSLHTRAGTPASEASSIAVSITSFDGSVLTRETSAATPDSDASSVAASITSLDGSAVSVERTAASDASSTAVSITSYAGSVVNGDSVSSTTGNAEPETISSPTGSGSSQAATFVSANAAGRVRGLEASLVRFHIPVNDFNREPS